MRTSPRKQPPLLLSPALEALVRAGTGGELPPSVRAVIAVLRAELGENLLGLVFYGSQLNSTAGPTSDHDFFVIVESYRAAHRRRIDAFLNRLLPPSIYHRRIQAPGGAEIGCKLCFLEGEDLVRGTSPSAVDSYLLGRLGKRVALVHWRDGAARTMIEGCIARSVALCGGWALRAMEAQFAPDAFVRASLGLSYRAELRVEGRERAEYLFSVDADYFRRIYGAVLEEGRRRGLVEASPAEGLLRTAGASVRGPGARRALDRFLRRSRVRARLRWLKNIYTFEGWADYMIAKIERHQGVAIVLTPWERRHLLLAAVRHYLRMRREGRVA